jgi:hypothetical protein
VATLRVVVEPCPKSRPLAQQRLVGDLDLARADRDQALVGEDGEDVGDPLALELGEGRSPAHDGVALSLAREAQQDPPRDVPVLWIEPFVRALRQPGYRAVHAARLAVGVKAQAPPVALLPQLQQRRRQQWQRAGLPLDVGDQRVHQVRLDAQAGALGRQLDRAAQLVAAHRADEDVVGAQQARQLGVGVAAAVEVGAHGNEHERPPARVTRGGDERVDERRSLALVAAGREDLLELVHGDDQSAARGGVGGRLLERAQRVLARTQQRERPALAAGQHTGGECGQQSGP